MTRLAALLVLAVLAGCGSGSDGDTSVSSPPDTGPVTTEPGDPGSGGAAIVTPTPGLGNVNPTAIDSAASTADDKLEVRFYNGVQACYGVDRVEVEETDADVTVTVFTGTLPGDGDRVCIDLAELQAVAVRLDAPLAGRALVDGSTGVPVPVG